MGVQSLHAQRLRVPRKSLTLGGKDVCSWYSSINTFIHLADKLQEITIYEYNVCILFYIYIYNLL